MDFKQLSASCWVSMISVSNLPHKNPSFFDVFSGETSLAPEDSFIFSTHELWHARGFGVHGSLVVCFNWWFGFRKGFPKNERDVLTKVLLYPPLKKNTHKPPIQTSNFLPQQKKTGVPYFSMGNPAWLIGILMSWFIRIPI